MIILPKNRQIHTTEVLSVRTSQFIKMHKRNEVRWCPGQEASLAPPY